MTSGGKAFGKILAALVALTVGIYIASSVLVPRLVEARDDMQDGPPAAAGEPASESTPEPAPEPSAEDAPGPTLDPEESTPDARLPALALPEGLLRTTDSRWTVAHLWLYDTDDQVTLVSSTQLIAPDLTRYELPDLAEDVRLVQWAPGTVWALAQASDGQTFHVVNLATGTIHVDLALARVLEQLDLTGQAGEGRLTLTGDGDLLYTHQPDTDAGPSWPGVTARVRDGAEVVATIPAHQTPQLSRDGRYLLTATAEGTVVRDAETFLPLQSVPGSRGRWADSRTVLTAEPQDGPGTTRHLTPLGGTGWVVDLTEGEAPVPVLHRDALLVQGWDDVADRTTLAWAGRDGSRAPVLHDPFQAPVPTSAGTLLARSVDREIDDLYTAALAPLLEVDPVTGTVTTLVEGSPVNSHELGADPVPDLIRGTGFQVAQDGYVWNYGD